MEKKSSGSPCFEPTSDAAVFRRFSVFSRDFDLSTRRRGNGATLRQHAEESIGLPLNQFEGRSTPLQRVRDSSSSQSSPAAERFFSRAFSRSLFSVWNFHTRRQTNGRLPVCYWAPDHVCLHYRVVVKACSNLSVNFVWRKNSVHLFTRLGLAIVPWHRRPLRRTQAPPGPL